MSHHKHRIQKSFNSAAASYDHHCCAQRCSAEKLITLLSMHNAAYKNVADVACGSGLSTEILIQGVEYSNLYALDFSAEILSTADKRCVNNSVEFIVADYDSYIFTQPMDLIFCNMGLQWSLDLSSTLAHFKSQLAPGGVMAFSLPLAGTFSALPEAVRNRFKTVAELEALLSALAMESVDSNISNDCYDYPNWLSALHSIKSLGAHTLLNPQRPKPMGLASPLRQLLRSDAPAVLNYHMGYFLLRLSGRVL